MKMNKYFKLARHASEMSDYNRKNIHIGAVLVYKKQILATGWNTNKTSPIQYKYNKYREEITDTKRTYSADTHPSCVHAEMMTLINTKDIDIDWGKARIYVYREMNGELRNCRPCPSCMKALKDRGIKTICYTTEDGYCKEDVL